MVEKEFKGVRCNTFNGGKACDLKVKGTWFEIHI
jgi:hypothetical protein